MARPKKNDSRNDMVTVRMNRDELEMVNYLANKKSMSIAEILRKGLEMQYKIEKYSD